MVRNCSDIDWDSTSYMSLGGSGVGAFCLLSALLLQIYVCRKFRSQPMLMKIQGHTLVSCLLALIIYIIVVLPRSGNGLLSTASCVGLGSVFYFVLLSSFFWIATEPLVSLICARRLNLVQPLETNVLMVALLTNYGVPFFLMLIVHLASNVSKPLYGSAFNVADSDSIYIDHQYCWFRDKTAAIVTMLVPSSLLTLGAVLSGLKAHDLCLKAECTQLQHQHVYRMALPPLYFLMWLIAGLGNGHLQAENTCETAVSINIAYCTISVFVCILIALFYRHSANTFSKLGEHETLAAQSLIFIKQRPLVLGSDSMSATSDTTHITSLLLSSGGSSSTLQRTDSGTGRKKRSAAAKTGQQASFSQVVSELPPLPSQFTLRPSGGKVTEVAARNMAGKEEAMPSKRSLHGPERAAADGLAGEASTISMPERVLDKSRSAVDITKALASVHVVDNPPEGALNLPDVGDIHKAEKEAAQMQSAPVPQMVDEVEMEEPRDFGQLNMSFDELDDSDPDHTQHMNNVKHNSLRQLAVEGKRKDVYSGPDGQSLTAPDEPLVKSIVTSAPSQDMSSGVPSNEQKGSTWPAKQPRVNGERPTRLSMTRKTSGRKNASADPSSMERRESWQSSDMESSEKDTLPKTRSLPGHRRQHHPPEGPGTELLQRPKRVSSRKAIQEDAEDAITSPDSYLQAHHHSVVGSLPGIDELGALEDALLITDPKKRSRASTVTSGYPNRASSEPNLSMEMQPMGRSKSAKNAMGERRRPRPLSPLAAPPHPDPGYWYQGGYGGGPGPYGPYPHQYPYGHYPPSPGYGYGYGGQPYSSPYSSPYGGVPYGYGGNAGGGGYHGPPQSGRSSKKFFRGSKKDHAEAAPMANMYAEVDYSPTNKKGHRVHFPSATKMASSAPV